MRRRRISTAARWGCTFTSVVIAAAWVGSVWWEAEWAKDGRDGLNLVYVGGGLVCACIGDPDIYGTGLRPDWLGLHRRPAKAAVFSPSALTIQCRTNMFGTDVRIPLYLPLLFTLAPASWLWVREVRRRRGVRAGACVACGYDRAGLASATAACPECGAIPARVG